MEKLTIKQRLKIKGPIVDVNNRLNGVFDSFGLFNNKFYPENRLIDMFSSHFAFYLSNRKSIETRKTHFCKLNKIVFNMLINSKTLIVVVSASIKNHVTTSIAHVHIHNSPVIKTIHHAINVTFTEAELFTIRCGLNQATQLTNIKYIIIITNSIHTAKRIFDSFIHPYQIQTLAIFKEIRKFFIRNHYCSLKFQDCSSQDKWSVHDIIDKETKKFNLLPLFPYKYLQDFS